MLINIYFKNEYETNAIEIPINANDLLCLLFPDWNPSIDPVEVESKL